MSLNTALGYPIVVEDSVRDALHAFVRDRGFDRYAVLCDANVVAYARSLTRSLPGRIALVPFTLGETHKHAGTLEEIWKGLLRAQADRSTLVIGVGGGVAADLFGFAAATYMRGVPYAHVATTLLAMCDAAIGGKTGVDAGGAKNAAGVFADPVAVFAHVDALRTLPYRTLRDGLAEVLKHAIIEGGDAFDALETLAPHPFARWPWVAIVEQSVTIKAAIVHDDRQERGERALLNLGHTFAHGIEAASRYRVAHGAAVAIGLRAAGVLALRTGRFSRDEHLRVLTLLTLLGMPLCTAQRPEAIRVAMRADKKAAAGTPRFVLPRAIGDVEYGIAVPERALRATLDRLSEPPGGREFT